MFGLLVLAAPFLVLQSGWSYALTEGHLVVLRFDRERRRIPLSEYVGRSMVAGAPWLKFRNGRVYVVSAMDDAQQAFLDELDRLVSRTGVSITEASTETFGTDGLRTKRSLLTFPGSPKRTVGGRARLTGPERARPA